MDRIQSFQKWWQKEILLQPSFRSHQFFLRPNLEAEALYRLMKEAHYLLQEELKSLELACVVKRGGIQKIFQTLYEHSWTCRSQLRSIELDLESQLKWDQRKPRPETISYGSFSCYTIDHLHPIAFFGPYLHLHQFLIELSLRAADKASRFLDDKKKEAAGFQGFLTVAWRYISDDEVSLVEETCFTAAKIFEYLLLSIEREVHFGSTSASRQDPKWPPSVLFHERRSPLIQA